MKKFLLVLLLLVCVQTVKADKWEIFYGREGVVPVAINLGHGNNYIITMESGIWKVFGKEFCSNELSNMRLHTVGSFYHVVDKKGKWVGGKNSIKWVENKGLTEKRKRAKSLIAKSAVIKKKTVVQPEKQIQPKKQVWIKIDKGLPPQNTAVLVKYKSGLLTVAYLDMENEWKLNTSRGDIFNQSIETITQWRIIE